MAKRFTDTDKWKKSFIKELSAEYKLFWFYLLDDCTHAGIWDVDIEVAELRTGCKLNKEDLIKTFEDKIHIFDDGKKWFIPAFIEFQYGELSEKNKLHISVKALLKKAGLLEWTPLRDPLEGAKDKEEEKDKELDKEKEIEPKINFKEIQDGWNEIATAKKLNTIKSIDRKRKDKLKVRFSEEEFNLKEIFKIIPLSPFLCGVNDRGWKVSFDWIIENSNNYLKILEGAYVSQKNGAISPFTHWKSNLTGKDSQLIEFDNEKEVGKLKRCDGTGEPFRITKYDLLKQYSPVSQ